MSHLLPFAQGSRVRVSQGNGGTKSHNEGGKAEFAWDFVPEVGDGEVEGTPIVATADGVVRHLKEDSNEGGDDPALINKANYLVICHGDGFCDVYLHLQHRSITNVGDLKLGDHVVRGQLIAAVGSTGWSSAPHLHFQHQSCVASPTKCTGYYFQQSVATTFADADVEGDNGLPQAGVTYTSDNGPTSLRESIQAIATQRAEDVMLAPALHFADFAQQADLGAPLSAVSRLSDPDGLQYFVQVFEADTIYVRTAPVGGEPDWNSIGRMTALIRPIVPPLPQPGGEDAWWEALPDMIIALTEDPAHGFALWLWGHTYHNAGMTFNDRQAAYWYALGQLAGNPLGAPLGSAVGGDPITVAGRRYYVMAHAKDAIYWEEGNWRDIHRLSDL